MTKSAMPPLKTILLFYEYRPFAGAVLFSAVLLRVWPGAIILIIYYVQEA